MTDKMQKMNSSLWDITPSAILTVDKDCRVTSFNRRAVELTGFLPEEVIGKKCVLFSSGECRGECVLLDRGKKVSLRAMECTLKTKFGNTITVLRNAETVCDVGGEIIGGIESFEDITDMINAVDVLSSQAEELDQKLKEIQCLYYISNLITVHSDSFSDTLFFNIVNLVPHALRYPERASVYIWLGNREYVSKDFKSSPLRLVHEIRVDEATVGSMEVFYQPGDGIDEKAPFSEDEKKALLVVAERVRGLTAGYKLKTNNAKLIKAVEQGTASVVITNTDGAIEYVNPRFLEITGYAMEEVVGQTPRILKTGFHTAEFYGAMWDTITSGRVWKGEFYNKKKNNEKYWESASISPITDEDGAIVNYVCVKEDITLRKQLEKQTKDMMDTKSRFLSMVSHELRTPLTAIKEGISIVYEGEAGGLNEDQKKFLDIAKRNVDRLHRLINDVLDFTKLESGKMEFHFQESSINRAIRDAVAIEASVAAGKGITLTVNADDRLPALSFDYDKIMQVLINLVSNAIKFTDAGSITISSSPDEATGGVKVSVADTGVGISEQDIDKVFVEFQQVGEGFRKTGSTGLGLAICKQIVAGHKGEIRVESKAGNGTAFIFTIPRG